MVRAAGREGCEAVVGAVGYRRVGGAELLQEIGREGDGVDALRLRPEVGGRRQGPPEPEVWKIQVPDGKGVQGRQERGTSEHAGCA